MKKIHLLALAVMSLSASAQVKTQITEFNHAGPFAVMSPITVDTVDVQGKPFDEKSLLQTISLTSPATAVYKRGVVPSLSDWQSVGVLSFYINNSDYLKATLKVEGLKNFKVFVDEKETSDLKLSPEHHTVAIKYLAQPSDTDSVKVSIEADRAVDYTLSKAHPYMFHDLTDGRRVRGVSLSADGQFVVVSIQNTERGGNSQWQYELRDAKSGRLLSMLAKNVQWMPRSAAYIEEEWDAGKRILTKVDPLTSTRTRFAYNIPQGGYTISPTEDYLIISVKDDGPKEDEGVYEVLEMDDRQPGWRSRYYLVKYDITSGLSQRITFGYRSHHLMDISQDGTQLLVGSNRSRLERRPTTVSDYFLIDARTLKVDTLILGGEFIDGADLSPDGRQLLVRGNPEAFNRIGCQLPADVTPSMTENELFLYDIASQQVTPLTKDFDPSVNSVQWSKADGMIYFNAENRDYVHIYQLNPKTEVITPLPTQGDNAYRWTLALHAPVMAYLSYETLAPASAYVVNLQDLKLEKSKLQTSNLKSQKLFDGHSALADATLGTCQDWNFTNSHGDTVYGRLYLPKDFDASKKYPMIVYYYGGCSPVSRYFESPYAPQYWNSLGYVAYILQPSGATGFGQEWASRHVNTAGGMPADDGSVSGGSPAGDIIEGVRRICDEHPFINREKIGCMGASYGGFMTQYLQTVTDIFAAAVSHAGIANHTSYWGEGYWGYNYSEVSMANSYPWSHRELYVDRSPLFRADKIHTPLLLLHGDADTNVPVIESLQMFTALKLLGREVALVEVKGENHHILDYKKREKWVATQMAWFQRWLKDDPSWWDALYPKKNL